MSLNWPVQLIEQNSLRDIPQLLLAELVTLPDSAVESALANLQLRPSHVPVSLRRTCYKFLRLLQSADKTWPANDLSYLDGIEDLCKLLIGPSTNNRIRIDKDTSIQLEGLIHNKVWPLVWCLKAVLADKDQIPLGLSDSLHSLALSGSSAAPSAAPSIPTPFNLTQRKSEAMALARSGACLLYWNGTTWLVRSSFSKEQFESALTAVVADRQDPKPPYEWYGTTQPPLTIDPQYILLYRARNEYDRLSVELPEALRRCGSFFTSIPSGYENTCLIEVSTDLDETQFKDKLYHEMEKKPLIELVPKDRVECLLQLVKFSGKSRVIDDQQECYWTSGSHCNTIKDYIADYNHHSWPSATRKLPWRDSFDGTLGALVSEEATTGTPHSFKKEQYALTCAHVVFELESPKQPEAEGFNKNCPYAVYTSSCDVALLALTCTHPTRFVDNGLYTGGYYPFAPDVSPQPGDKVYKKGMKTGLTFGTILATMASFDSKLRQYTNQVVIKWPEHEEDHPFASPGDSGSLYFFQPKSEAGSSSESSFYPLAIHRSSAKYEQSRISIGTPWATVLSNLQTKGYPRLGLTPLPKAQMTEDDVVDSLTQ